MADGLVGLVTGFRTGQVRQDAAGRAVLVAEDGRELAPADAVVVLTGFRPDLSFLTEVRLDLDPVLQAPRADRAGIDPNIHSCGTATPTRAADLAHPEPGLYLVGMKSYGRAPTFLAMTGYEQVRSVAAELAGRPRGRRPPRARAARHRGMRRGRPARRPGRRRRRAAAARPPRRCCRSASPRPAGLTQRVASARRPDERGCCRLPAAGARRAVRHR